MTTPEHILDAVRGYLIDVTGGTHTLGNWRIFAKRYDGCDPSDIPAAWTDLPDDTHMTKAMMAEVLYRAFKRAERESTARPQFDPGMRRGWINQPSTLQPMHKHHGKEAVIADRGGPRVTLYFPGDGLFSMLCPRECVAFTWPPVIPTGPTSDPLGKGRV